MLNKSGLFSPLFSPLMTKGVTGRGVVSGGVVPVPPAGFVFITDDDGAYLIDQDGYYLLEAA